MSVYEKRIVIENTDGSLAIIVPNSPIVEGETEKIYLDRIFTKAKKNLRPGAKRKINIDITDLPLAASDDTTVVEDHSLSCPTCNKPYGNKCVIGRHEHPAVVKGLVADKIRHFRDAWRLKNGKVIVDANLETKERWKTIKNIRDILLTLSDGETNAQVEQKGPKLAALKTYRQKLRDVPQEHSNPHEVVWPPRP